MDCGLHPSMRDMLLPKGGITWKSTRARLPPSRIILNNLLRTRVLFLTGVAALIIIVWRWVSVEPYGKYEAPLQIPIIKADGSQCSTTKLTVLDMYVTVPQSRPCRCRRTKLQNGTPIYKRLYSSTTTPHTKSIQHPYSTSTSIPSNPPGKPSITKSGYSS